MYKQQERYSEAHADFLKAMEVGPTDPVEQASLWLHLGDASLYQQEYARALDEYQRVVELNPQYSPVYRKRAECYWQLQRVPGSTD